jgi:hypothetical protein
MNTVKATCGQALGDAAGHQTGTEQLTGRDNAVLVRRKARDHRVRS